MGTRVPAPASTSMASTSTDIIQSLKRKANEECDKLGARFRALEEDNKTLRTTNQRRVKENKKLVLDKQGLQKRVEELVIDNRALQERVDELLIDNQALHERLEENQQHRVVEDNLNLEIQNLKRRLEVQAQERNKLIQDLLQQEDTERGSEICMWCRVGELGLYSQDKSHLVRLCCTKAVNYCDKIWMCNRCWESWRERNPREKCPICRLEGTQLITFDQKQANQGVIDLSNAQSPVYSPTSPPYEPRPYSPSA